MKGHWEVPLGGGAGRSIATERGHCPGGDTGNNSHWEESMGEPTSETVAKIGKAPKIRDGTPTRCAVEVVSVVCWVKERRGNHEPITQAGGERWPHIRDGNVGDQKQRRSDSAAVVLECDGRHRSGDASESGKCVHGD